MMRVCGAIVFAALALPAAAEPPPGVVGKDGWLFYRYEAADASAAADTKASAQLVARLAHVLAKNDVALAVTLVPLKMRVYARYLPAGLKLTPYLAGQYPQLAKSFRAQDVPFIDLDTAFVSAAKRDADARLFFRLDTHWAPQGAMLAAETIRAGIEAHPGLKAILDTLPEQKYRVSWDDRPSPTVANDLVGQLPADAPKFDAEQVLHFHVERQKPEVEGLLDDSGAPRITLVGSSYSADWTMFPEAFRYALQRDVLSIAVPANQGSWVGMESYLRDDAFQTRPPRLIVWELPERDMVAPPDFKYREARYRMDNTEWLLRAAAWAAMKCEPARASVKSVGGKLAQAAASEPGEWIEIVFSRPLERLEYVSARLTTHGSTRVGLEASGPGSPKRKSEIGVPGDEAAHAFRTPLYTGSGKGHDKLRLYPGATHRFSLDDVQVCRHPDGLLK